MFNHWLIFDNIVCVRWLFLLSFFCSNIPLIVGQSMKKWDFWLMLVKYAVSFKFIQFPPLTSVLKIMIYSLSLVISVIYCKWVSRWHSRRAQKGPWQGFHILFRPLKFISDCISLTALNQNNFRKFLKMYLHYTCE